MIWPLVAGLFWPTVSLAQLLTQDDPKKSSIPYLDGQALFNWAMPRDSVFWKADSDGNEWRKDSYGTIWKKEAGMTCFEKDSWVIDGYDSRQTRRISADTLMQFKLNLDGSIKPESVRQITWIYSSDPSPSTLPTHLRKADPKNAFQGSAQIQRQIPKAVIPTQTPK